MTERKLTMLTQMRAASFTPATVNVEARTVVFVASTGTMVRRQRWVGWDIEEYNEVLRVTADAVDLTRVNAGAPLLNSHDSTELESVLGVTLRGWIENNQLMIECKFSERADVEPYWRDVQQGILRNVSVGYVVKRYVDVTATDATIPTLEAVEWDIYELSLVPIPADAGAQVRSAGKQESTHDCVVTLRQSAAQSMEQSTMTVQTDASGANQMQPAEQAQNTHELQTQAVQAERARVAELQVIARSAKLDDAWLSAAIAGGTAADAARRHALDQIATRSEAVHITASIDTRAQGSTAAALAADIEQAIIARATGDDSKLTADQRYLRGKDLLSLGAEFLNAQGINVRTMGKIDLAQSALQKRDGAVGYHTTSDFASVLASVTSKMLMRGYSETPRTFLPMAVKNNLRDFKPSTLVALGAAPDLLEVPEHEEYKDGSTGDVSQSVKLAKYGRVFSITYEALINDDMNVLSRIPMQFGASAARLESDKFYDSWLTAPTINTGIAGTPTSPLFATAVPVANMTATGTALNVAGLQTAALLMAQQTGYTGEMIDLMPKFLVVPPELAVQAEQLMSTALLATKASDINPYAGKFTVIVEKRLSRRDATGALVYANGDKNWYLVADPMTLDCLSYGYLDGAEGVQISTRDGFRVDGVETKARHHFYAKPLNFRGIVKARG